MLSIGPYIALAALVVAVALAGMAYSMSRRQARLEAGQRAILGVHDEQDLVTHALDLEEQVRNLREAVTILTDEVERYRHDLDAALSNIAVVRFDAFRDSGGEQSASIALLDSYRSGVVISVFAAREFARIYVKYLDHGVPDRELAPEEAEAVRRAVPQALARGELSRAPVSSFPRDVRWAVEQVRQAAAQAAGEEPAGAQPAAGTKGPDAGMRDAGTDPPSARRVSIDEVELGFDWVEAVPAGAASEEAAYGEPTLAIPGLEEGAVEPAAAPAGPPPRDSGPRPGPTSPSVPSARPAAQDPDGMRPAKGPHTTVPESDIPAAGQRPPAEDHPPSAAPRRDKKDADWLGGEDLDF